jgi:hypothetical protein
LAVYLSKHLGEGVPPGSIYASSVQNWRMELRRALVEMLWRPLQVRQQFVQNRMKFVQDRMNSLLNRIQEEARLREKLQRERNMLAAQEAKVKFDAHVAREYAQLLRDLAKDGLERIASKLKDEQPLVRWLAVQVAGRKRLPLERELIGLLSDPEPLVRQAAREALMRLSRGNDFGPLPTATAKQITQSLRAWRQWHSLQDPPERVPEYIACPQPAGTADSPGRIAERVPPSTEAER